MSYIGFIYDIELRNKILLENIKEKERLERINNIKIFNYKPKIFNNKRRCRCNGREEEKP